jgi:hypothetical protein
MSQLLDQNNTMNQVYDVYCNSLNANQVNSQSLITATFGTFNVLTEGTINASITFNYYKIGRIATIYLPEFIQTAEFSLPLDIPIPLFLGYNQII